MSGAIPPLPQYAFMGWCLVEAQEQLYLLFIRLLIFEGRLLKILMLAQCALL
jgi:hypothetical protein